MNKGRAAFTAVALAAALAGATTAFGDGDMAPQPVETKGLPDLDPDWKSDNPYRGNARALEVGASGYNQNYARCHGLDVKSGGIAPDLRYLAVGDEGDVWFSYRVINGAERDGRIYMPKFYGVLSQEALWAIRTYIESKHVDE
ncbi:cytochrome c-550 PedF [Methylocella sp.]|uniref:cytochrome c-550 PedF n=1 Tax=Methylocella sp. TaxID=1978226 RepID=UPI0037831FB2